MQNNRAVDELTDAYLLHQTRYRETSMIVELMTRAEGYVRAVCKGVRTSGRTAVQRRAALQPFAELALSYSGRGELKTLRRIEKLESPPRFTGRVLYSAMYANELLVRALRDQGQASDIYPVYQQVLRQLAKIEQSFSVTDASPAPAVINSRRDNLRLTIEASLREFEFGLLKALGYQIDTLYEAGTGRAIKPGNSYHYHADSGFVLAERTAAKSIGHSPCLPGEQILSIDASDLVAEIIESPALLERADIAARLKTAKLVAREALRVLLAEKPLKTRELFG